MNRIRNSNGCLASLAIFGELYTKRKDVYSIIGEFLTSIIVSDRKHNFSLVEITETLNKEFEFNIPQSVVKTSLKRLKYLRRENHRYINDKPLEISTLLPIRRKEIISKNDSLVEKLNTYIGEQIGKKLSRKERKDVAHSFSSFLLDDTNGKKYSNYISSFIILHQNDTSFKDQIKMIKEGVIIYSGLKYSIDLNDFGGLKSDLVIFIDTEILFKYFGYDGELYKKLADDFFNYVNELNRKSSNHKIILKYFDYTKLEIDKYFVIAERIISGETTINPSKTAMASIVNGCKDSSDVITKKVEFYSFLKQRNIKKDNYCEYFDEKNYEFSKFNQTMKDQILSDLNISDVEKHFDKLNNINILRKNCISKNFYNTKYILLSGNYKLLRIAWHDSVKNSGEVPLATSLSFVTDKLWYKLNKGFGNQELPTSFNVLTKAQIVLSTSLNNKISSRYDTLNNDLTKGKLTKESAIATIIELRKQVIKPEDVNVDDLDQINDIITEKNIKSYKNDYDYIKSKNIKIQNENDNLKDELGNKEKELYDKEKIIAKELNNLRKTKLKMIKSSITSKSKLLESKKETVRNMDLIKLQIDKKVAQRIRFLKIFICLFFVGYFLFSFLAIWIFGWDMFEKWTYIINFSIPVILFFLYFLFVEEEWNIIKFISNKGEKYMKKLVIEYNYNEAQYNSLQVEIITLKKESKKLNDQLNELRV